MNFLLNKLHNFLEHPMVEIAIAVILIASSLAEGWETFSKDLSEFDVGAHHGVLIFGFAMLLRAIVDALDATKRLENTKN